MGSQTTGELRQGVAENRQHSVGREAAGSKLGIGIMKAGIE